MSLGDHWFHNLKICSGNRSRIENGLRILTSQSKRRDPERKCLKQLVFWGIATRVSQLAGRQGVFTAVFRNPNKDNELRCKPFEPGDLGFSDFSFAFVRSRLFSDFSGAMTLEMSIAANL
jgi:hypothetical protein